MPVLVTCGVLLKIWCSSEKNQQTIILCNWFRISEKTPHTPCTFEDSNYCHLLEYMPIAMAPVFLGDRCDHIDLKLSKVVEENSVNIAQIQVQTSKRTFVSGN